MQLIFLVCKPGIVTMHKANADNINRIPREAQLFYYQEASSVAGTSAHCKTTSTLAKEERIS